GFRAAVHGKVLGSGHHVGQRRIVSLHAFDEGHAEPRREIWVFAVGFLPPTPARIAEDIEIGRPGVEPRAYAPHTPGLPGKRMEPAHFGADRARDILDQRSVARRG